MHSCIDLIYKKVTLLLDFVYTTYRLFLCIYLIFWHFIHLSAKNIQFDYTSQCISKYQNIKNIKMLCLISTPLTGCPFCMFVRLENKVDLFHTNRMSQMRHWRQNSILRFSASHIFLWDVSCLQALLGTWYSQHLTHPPLTLHEVVAHQQRALTGTFTVLINFRAKQSLVVHVELLRSWACHCSCTPHQARVAVVI